MCDYDTSGTVKVSPLYVLDDKHQNLQTLHDQKSTRGQRRVHTWQNVGESVLAHVGWLDGGDDGTRLGVIRTQRVPLLL